MGPVSSKDEAKSAYLEEVFEDKKNQDKFLAKMEQQNELFIKDLKNQLEDSKKEDLLCRVCGMALGITAAYGCLQVTQFFAIRNFMSVDPVDTGSRRIFAIRGGFNSEAALENALGAGFQPYRKLGKAGVLLGSSASLILYLMSRV